jgi:hypothetical protein
VKSFKVKPSATGKKAVRKALERKSRARLSLIAKGSGAKSSARVTVTR